VELFADEVPGTVANFEKLATQAFTTGRNSIAYPELHDPGRRSLLQNRQGSGRHGWPRLPIKCADAEEHPQACRRHAVDGTRRQDTGGSQFFICHAPQRHRDGVHTVFGQVTKGMDVVNAIKGNDEITSIRVS